MGFASCTIPRWPRWPATGAQPTCRLPLGSTPQALLPQSSALALAAGEWEWDASEVRQLQVNAVRGELETLLNLEPSKLVRAAALSFFLLLLY